MKIVATIEARMSSSRLKGKILKDLLGQPLLGRMIERLKRCRKLDDIVVATTLATSDEATEIFCKDRGIACFRGSEEDVLDRVLQAARVYDADLIVELTGDCPLVDPELIDCVIAYYLANQEFHDYISTALQRTFPRGLDVQVFSRDVLEEVARLTVNPADREHVSLYIYEHPERFRLHNIEAMGSQRRPDLRLTVDTEEDFELIREIYSELYPGNPYFTLTDIISLIDKRPELQRINRHIEQKPVRLT